MSNAHNASGWETGPLVQHIFQTMTMWVLVATTVVAWLSIILSASGVWPWLGLDLRFGPETTIDAGIYVQTGFALLMLGLCAFLPGVTRMLSLERSHRSFSITMEDVAKAYKVSHDADRLGRFALSSEFDAVRERLELMRHHPDLSRLEPEVMELAAQMSFTTRDLADVYSDEKVDRARAFLKGRQKEIEDFQDKLIVAKSTIEEIKRWQADIESSERETNRQMDVLEKDLREVLPALGYMLDEPALLDDEDDHKVVPMQSTTGGLKNGSSKERPN